MKVNGLYFCICATRKQRKKLFPEPIAPRTTECPTSSRCRFRKYGVLCRVSRTARYSVPRNIFRGSPAPGVKTSERSEVFALETHSSLRLNIELPGRIEKNALSRL